MPDTELLGGVEAGGTKFICAIGRAPDSIVAQAQFPTVGAVETLNTVIGFFQEQEKLHGQLAGFGIATFGPAEVDPASPHWGAISATPKPGWSGADIVGRFRTAFNVPIGFDTDVNGAALAEARWGASIGATQSVYITVGTGIGGGIVVNGKALHGLLHPEIGHIRPRIVTGDEKFAGVCPFHGDCLEGLASGPAIKARWGASLSQLPFEHPAWAMEANYLGQLCAQLILTVSPQRIILGGGVMNHHELFPLIRQQTQVWLGGYVGALKAHGTLDALIVPPALGTRSGMCGALYLAENALENSR